MIMIIILRQHNLYVVKLNDDGGGDTAEAGKFLLRTILWQTIEHEIGEINKLWHVPVLKFNNHNLEDPLNTHEQLNNSTIKDRLNGDDSLCVAAPWMNGVHKS